MDKPLPTYNDLDALRQEWSGLEGEALIRAAHAQYGDKLALLSSFGADAAVTLSLVAKVDTTIPVLFLDTHKHFQETLEYVQTLKQHFGLTNLHIIQPDTKLTGEFDPTGQLHETDPDLCCHIRKVTALEDYVRDHGFAAIMSGRMRGQTAVRATMETVEWDVDKNILNLNPIANWTQQQADAIKATLPQHPLLVQGYHSIGCACCTKKGEGREGRWAQAEKAVCGINGSDAAGADQQPRQKVWMFRVAQQSKAEAEIAR